MGAFEENYKLAVEKPLKILEIFNDFFTEARVDLQGLPSLEATRRYFVKDSPSVEQIKAYCNGPTIYILVHFPHVRVTNEYDKYTDVCHLYAKVVFDIEGKIEGRFTLNRSEYSIAHMRSNYMHSHISYIPFSDFTEFQMPCTGSGPINNTICSLSRQYDEDLWRLFCLELSKFVEVESISGTPYHRLEGIGRSEHLITVCDEFSYVSNATTYTINKWRNNLRISKLAEFTKYLIDNDMLKYTFNGCSYVIALPPTEMYIRISNAFIKWYNQLFNKGEVTERLTHLYDTGLLDKFIFSNGKLHKEGNGRPASFYLQYQGKFVCNFKNKPVTVNITGFAEDDSLNEVNVLDKDICCYIVTNILNVLNFRYGNNRDESSVGEEVRFI